MYASVRRSKIDSSQFEAARAKANEEIIPRVRQLPGAVAGYWLAPVDGIGMSVIVFESKEDAERPIPNAQPGQNPAPGVTVQSLEVREVIAKF